MGPKTWKKNSEWPVVDHFFCLDRDVVPKTGFKNARVLEPGFGISTPIFETWIWNLEIIRSAKKRGWGAVEVRNGEFLLPVFRKVENALQRFLWDAVEVIFRQFSTTFLKS